MSKIGIFSGTFDPVHGGHIAFALEALQTVGLDKVYLLPEPMPRRKQAVTHYAHRVAMLRLALKPYPKLGLLELPDSRFSVSRTLPRLQKKFPKDDLFMLIGSDMLQLLASKDAVVQWPDSGRLLEMVTLIVGIRSGLDEDAVAQALAAVQPKGILVKTGRAHASSRDIRTALMKGQEHHELLVSLKKYISKNWLYASLETVASANNS